MSSQQSAAIVTIFEMMHQGLTHLDEEQKHGDGPGSQYAFHRAMLNRRLHEFNFVVGVNHFDRHCLTPLIEGQNEQ